MFQFNATYLDENGNMIINEDSVNNSSLLIEEIGKNFGFNNLYYDFF